MAPPSSAVVTMEDEVWESASETLKGMEKGSHLFVVENYSLRKGIGVNEPIESEEFFVGGYQWTIRLYPGGKTVSDNEAGMASLYICPRSETTDPLPCSFEMQILDQSGKGHNWGRSIFEEEGYVFTRKGLMSGRAKFVLRALLESPDYLKHDCLKIYVTIGVLTSQDKNLPVINVPRPSIREDLGKLLQSKTGADLVCKVKNETFSAHKWILAARCPVFLPYLSDCHQTKEIDVPDMDPKVFKVVLWYVYRGVLPEEELDDCDFTPSMLSSFMARMLAAADRFQLRGLKKICESRISTRISGESVAYLLHLAELCHAKELKAACLRFGAENELGLLDVMDADGRKYLRETCPSLFLELAYKQSYPLNALQEHDSYNNIFSAVKESIVGILGPHGGVDRKHKIKEV